MKTSQQRLALEETILKYETNGYVNVNQMAQICLDLDPDFSHSSLTEDVKFFEFQKNKTMIPKEEFLEWWLRHPLMNKEMACDSHSLPQRSFPPVRTRLLQAKLSRKQAEYDSKLLENRITLLENEEQRAWKKINQTKQRSLEIYNQREHNQQRLQLKRQLALEKEKFIEDCHKKTLIHKKESDETKQKIQRELAKKKIHDVKELRTKSRQLRFEKELLQKESIDAAKKCKEVVKANEIKARNNRKKRDEEKLKQNSLGYLEKVHREAVEIRKKEKLVRKMEKEEKCLIQRLQNTQLLQKEAYLQLEHALTNANAISNPKNNTKTATTKTTTTPTG